MKLVRSALLFIISVALFSACFNPPEFNNTPSIEFEDIKFQKNASGDDELVVSVSFKDGDGDLGLSSQDFKYVIAPYNEINFFGNDNGQLFTLSSTLIPSFAGYHYKKTNKTPKESSYFIDLPPKQVDGLITLASRNEGFPALPPFASPYDCAANLESYLNDQLEPDTIFISRVNDYLIKDKSTIVDTLVRNGDPSEYYFVVVDYFYINVNPGYYNFKVQFFVKDGNGTFTEYDFRKEFCETYDGRFPPLSDNPRALEGTINYSMVSSGFSQIFSIKTMKLAITIYDQALHASNTIETPEFRLEEI